MVTRRSLLLGGLAAVGLAGAGFAGVAEDVLPGGPALRRQLGWTGPAGVVPDVPAARVTTRHLASAARGRTVQVSTVVPADADPSRLPVCVVLHGRNSSAQGMLDLGLPRFLTAAVHAGTPPFALVTLDGGRDTYWINRRPGDDPQAMLRDELPGWLAQVGLPAPRAAFGISMGGFGSLVHTRDTPLTSVAVLSPAVFPSWAAAQRVGVFDGEAQWADAEPLRHPLPDTLRLGVWCGLEDPFLPGARQLTQQHHAQVASFEHGAHNPDYWRRVIPAAFQLTGAALADQPA